MSMNTTGPADQAGQARAKRPEKAANRATPSEALNSVRKKRTANTSPSAIAGWRGKNTVASPSVGLSKVEMQLTPPEWTKLLELWRKRRRFDCDPLRSEQPTEKENKQFEQLAKRIESGLLDCVANAAINAVLDSEIPDLEHQLSELEEEIAQCEARLANRHIVRERWEKDLVLAALLRDRGPVAMPSSQQHEYGTALTRFRERVKSRKHEAESGPECEQRASIVDQSIWNENKQTK